MWLAKIPFILWIFSGALLFGMYYMDTAFASMQLFDAGAYEALDELLEKGNTVQDEEITLDLLFGDFLAATRVAFGIVSGEAIGDILVNFPNFNEAYALAARVLYAMTAPALWIYLVAGRSV